jgi:hypothetical protein
MIGWLPSLSLLAILIYWLNYQVVSDPACIQVSDSDEASWPKKPCRQFVGPASQPETKH